MLEAFVTSDSSSDLDSELSNTGLSKLLSWIRFICSHSGRDPDGLGASSTNSAVVAENEPNVK